MEQKLNKTFASCKYATAWDPPNLNYELSHPCEPPWKLFAQEISHVNLSFVLVLVLETGSRKQLSKVCAWS